MAVLDGELTVKGLQQGNGITRLLAENPLYRPIEITEQQTIEIWGVATNVIHPF